MLLHIVAKGTGQVNPKGRAGLRDRLIPASLIRYDGRRIQESIMTREELIKEVRKAAVNGRLSCEAAHRLSGEMKVPLGEIGALCNELNIKIASCQLGCF